MALTAPPLSETVLTAEAIGVEEAVTVAFHPNHLGRGEQFIAITYDPLIPGRAAKDSSSPPLVSALYSDSDYRSFTATQNTDAAKPHWISGEGIRYRTIGGVRRWLDMPNVEVNMDHHYVAVLFKLDPALCASEVNGFTFNGTSTSAGLRWPFFHVKSNGTTATVYAGWWENNAAAEGGYTGHTITGTGWHSFVSTVRNGVVYSSLDDGPIQSHGSNIRASRNTSGATGIKGSFHATRDLEYTERWMRIGPAQLTDAEISKMHGYMAWSILGSTTHLNSASAYKTTAPTTLEADVETERARRAAVISSPTEITPITPDESYSYQQTLDWTGEVPTGFTKTFESLFTNGAADITHEATGAGPWWAPSHPPLSANDNWGGANVTWAAYNDATAFQNDTDGVKLGVYRVTSGQSAIRSASIASVNHEGTLGFSQKHGLFACRVKLDAISRTTSEPEIWSAPMWLLSLERHTDRSMVYGEADFPEVYSKDPAAFHGSLHEHDPAFTGQPGGHPDTDYLESNYIKTAMQDAAKWNLGSNGYFDGQFHEHAVLFDPDRDLIISYLDKREIERRPYPSGMQNMSWFMLFWNHVLYANITSHDASKTWMGPHFMTIDWVRVFQKAAWT